MRARTRILPPILALSRDVPALVAAALLLAACASDAREPAVFRDSAGVTIIESRAPAAEAWTLVPEPAVSIGADPEDDSSALYDVGGVTRLDDGRIVITDGGTRQIRAYTAAGERLAAAGRAGEGPGEFRSLGRPFRVAGDSILVFDFSLRRASVFDASLRFGRDFRLQQPAGGEPVSPAIVMGGAEILARPGFVFGSATPTGSYRGDIPYLRFRMDGTLIDSAGRFPGEEHFVFTEEENSIALVLPFRPRPRIAATADGFVYGSAERLEIGRYDRGGRLLARLRGPDRAAPFTPDRRRRFRDDVLAGAPADERSFFERLLAAIPMPEVLPAWSDLAVDADGRIWVGDFAWEDQDSVSWSVFAADGTLAATIVMPAKLEVQEIGSDWILGLWRDALGVESVRLYELRR